MTYDASINIDTRVNSGGMNQGIASIKNSLNGLKSVLGGVAGAIGIAFATMGLAQFAGAAIEAASDLTEVQNVVDTAFGEMAGQAEEFAQTAIKQFGLTELQAKQFSSNFMAMGQSMGLAKQQAADMAIELTGLAGDVASFYNISQDEAYTKLKSVFTGETESLKELGVVMTEDNLKAYALAQGMGASYSAMSQAEKVALRYGYVASALSLAQGDFAKTSSTWANNVRVLKNQFTSLIAVLGKGFIAVLNPVVTVMNSILAVLIDFANGVAKVFSSVFGSVETNLSATAATVDTSGLSDSLGDVGAAASDAADSVGSVGDATKDAAKAASELNRQTMAFDKINKLSSNNSGSSGSSGGGSSGGGSGGGTSGAGVSGGTAAAANSVLDSVLDKTNAFSEAMQRFRDFLAGLDFTPLEKAWDRLKEAAGRLGEILKGALYWGLENVLEPLAKWTIEEAAPRLVELLANAFDILSDVLVIIQPGAQWLWENLLAPLAKETADTFTAGIDGLNIALEAMHEALKDIIKVMDGDMTFEELVNKWLEPIDDSGYDYSNIKPLDKEEVRKALGGQGDDKSFDLIGFIFGEGVLEDTRTTLELIGTDIANFFTVDLPQLLDPLNLVDLIFGDAFMEDTMATFKLFGEDIVTFFTKDIPSLIDNGLENTLREIELFSPENIDKALQEALESAAQVIEIGVKLVKSGWDTLEKWVGKIPTLSQLIKLVKDGWSTVSHWIGNLPGISQAIKLAKSGWSSVKSWVGTIPVLSAGIKLVKSGWSTVKKWLGDLTAKLNIKIPKISVKWGTAKKLGVSIPWPKFSVRWNAKGGILNGAQIFGMAGNTLLGGGEAGREAVLPLDRNTGWMDTLASRIAAQIGSGGGKLTVQVTLDGKVVGQTTVDYLRNQAMQGYYPLSGVV